jgi:hypothetical protein
MNHALDARIIFATDVAWCALGGRTDRSGRGRGREAPRRAARSRPSLTNPDVPYEGLPDATAIVGRVRVERVGVATISMRARQ